MNSLVSSFRTALRLQPARTYAPCCRAYSTQPPASVGSTAEDAPSPAAPSSPSSELDQVIKSISASKGKGRLPHGAAAAQRTHSARPSAEYSSLYSSPSPRSAQTASTPEQIWAFTPPVVYTPPVSLTSARSFAVRDGNVARAYRNLNRTLRENNVRLELRRQERFESPSNKRVRLNSERHRRRFKVAVGKAVALAMRMKDK
ncbi:hypothetical protein JCM8115_005078 [Rhodotorula mucilaginosa]|jgi:ribosomal protein S21|uniref:Ribosomal protein S21 n=1 Tax=Rhodotorula mucilaginosa TaxID=5537 RepID=A0A9P6WA72_RHOMI|nr:hypothetical protein C6P46_000143 [Rhodotorula mucilaginosa]TKA58462.1 hypothetical protein B0A53_00201 [Rhodotorula sp. CCFEE 5036]